MLGNPVKTKMRAGELTFGTWCVSGNALVTEVLARSQFDWLTIEMEHSGIDYDDCLRCLLAIEAAGKVPYVRVAWNDPMLIKRVLDIGALGVIVPNVDTAEDAERAVRASRYAPDGQRGVGTARGQLVYGNRYFDDANAAICVGVMIESAAAVENIEAIMRVPGVDLCFIGPNDLASSLGVPLGLDNQAPAHVAAVEKVVAAAKAAKMPLGIHCTDGEEALRRIEQGFTWIAVGSDLRMVSLSVDEIFKTVATGATISNGRTRERATFY